MYTAYCKWQAYGTANKLISTHIDSITLNPWIARNIGRQQVSYIGATRINGRTCGLQSKVAKGWVNKKWICVEIASAWVAVLDK